jgi:hypothetical protein
MLQDRVKLISETLARTVDRRGFLQRAGATAFAGLAALASGHILKGDTSARGWVVPAIPQCSPPGPYCNLNGTNEPNGCANSHPGGPYSSRCFEHLNNGQVLQCRVSYQWYNAGCWTRAAGGGYWTCCDCECGNPVQTTCGCAAFSLNPNPGNDRPGQPGGRNS